MALVKANIKKPNKRLIWLKDGLVLHLKNKAGLVMEVEFVTNKKPLLEEFNEKIFTGTAEWQYATEDEYLKCEVVEQVEVTSALAGYINEQIAVCFIAAPK